MSTTEQILALGRRWAEAEQRGDTTTLDAITTEDFTLIGRGPPPFRPAGPGAPSA
jgi:hypothetical protein